MADADFGFKRIPEKEKAKRVGEVFDRVADRYDLMNDLMSFGMHRLWKAFTVSIARIRPGERVLDVASGSGDLARAFAARGAEVWMSDINGPMLARGRDRMLDAGRMAAAVRCDAERLPFAEAYFDCVSVGFGLRNMTHRTRHWRKWRGYSGPADGCWCLSSHRCGSRCRNPRSVFFLCAALAGSARGGRRGCLPLPRRIIRMHGPADIGGNDGARRAGSGRILQSGRRGRSSTSRHQTGVG